MFLTLAITAFVLLDLVLVAWVFYRRSRPRLTERDLELVRKTWRAIEAGAHPKNDLLEADKLLDFVLAKHGYRGSLGDKLKSAEKVFSDLNGVWRAHKLRNRIGHELNFTPTPTETTAALVSFRRALRDLGVNV